MRRREFITILSGAATLAVWPYVGHPQQRKIPRIGIIDDTPDLDYFRQALRDLGYIQGETIAFELRVAKGELDQLAVAPAELVRLPVDVIVAHGTQATQAAQRATTTIPIVAITIGDPVRTGLVTSLARPGGNITGNVIFGPDLVGKRLQILSEVLPNLSRVALLWNPDNASNAALLEDLRVAVSTLRMTLVTAEVRRDVDFEGAFARLLDKGPQAVITADLLHSMHISTILEFLAKSRLPRMFPVKEHVVAGGLMSYGPSRTKTAQLGLYISEELKEAALRGCCRSTHADVAD